MRKSILSSGLAATAIIAGAVLVSATPAQAAIQDCPSGRSCGWQGTSYTGAFAAYAQSTPNLLNFHDTISSYNNRLTRSVTWFSDEFYTGRPFDAGRGAAGYFTAPDLRNDAFDSIRVNTF